MPHFRPDVYAVKKNSRGRILAEIVVEAEITSTVASDHTRHQLMYMQEFLEMRRKKGINSRGILAVPREAKALARLQLVSTIPVGLLVRVEIA